MSDFAICKNCFPKKPGWRCVFRSGCCELWVTDGPGHPFSIYTECNFCTIILGICSELNKITKWGKNYRQPEQLSDAVGCMTCGAVIDPEGFSVFRDKTGLIPVVEFEGQNGVYAVTTSPDFLDELTVHSRIRASWMANYLAVRDDDSTADVMEGAERLRPGELTEYRHGIRKRLEYWPGPSFFHPLHVNCKTESAVILRDAFVQAVSRIPRDFPCTYTMSGGLDSCGIIGVSLAHGVEQESPLHAVSLISTHHADSDESREIGIMERHFGLSVQRIDMDEDDSSLKDIIRDSYRFNAFGPQSGYGNKPTLMMFSRVARERPHSRLILGMGGNLLVDSGVETPWIDLALRKDWGGFLCELQSLSVKQIRFYARHLAANIYNGKLRSFIKNVFPGGLRDRILAPVMPLDLLGPLRNSAFVARHPVPETALEFFIDLQKFRLFELRSWQNEFCRRSTDQYMRLTGVQFYDPLFDPELCEICARLPVRAHIRQNKYRPAYIEALSPYLPNEILYHPKVQSFDAVCNEWLIKQARPGIEDILKNTNNSEITGFINLDVLYNAFGSMCDSIINDVPIHPLTREAVWRAVSICL